MASPSSCHSGGRSLTCSVLLLLSLAAWRGVHGAGNIDTLEPVVRRSPAPLQMNSAGILGDWFGYSAAMHQLVEPSSFDEALQNTRIIVGAPRGTFPGGLPLNVTGTPVNETGLVYNCPMLRGACERLGSGMGADEKLFDSQPDQKVARMLGGPVDMVEAKSGQLMGATVVSSGDFLVACAPRFAVADDLEASTSSMQNLDTRRPTGRCYISPRNLTGFKEMRPCVSQSSAGPEDNCLTGFSAVINKLANEQVAVVLGTPGQSSFRGAAALYSVNDSSAMFSNIDLPTVVAEYTYQSYAMTTGNITGNLDLDYIMSAPRADGSLFKGRVLIRPANDITTVAPDMIQGFQNGEYFGWSLGAADLNNDGYDELLVGAPLYSTTDAQEYGRVYVFKNIGGSLSTMDPIILSGDDAAGARFGTSVTRIGDVNDDGFEDFAVGAPYQSGSNSGSTGKVFIYYGSESFVGNFPGQEITADDVVNAVAGLSQLKSFGWSLSSGVDVDKNEYQDLLVGAYDSGTAVLLRALSVARIVITGSTNLPDNTLSIDLTAEPPFFNLTICASFSGRGLTGPLVTNLNVREMGAGGRLYFDGAAEVNKDFTFTRTNEETCTYVNVTIQDKDRIYSSGSTVADFDIAFTMTQDERVVPPTFNGSSSTLTDLRQTPILLITGNTSITVIPQVTCMGQVCRPDLALTITNYTYLSNITKTVYPNIVAGSTGVDTIITNIRIRNLNLDAATGARMQISIPTQFVYFEGNTTTGVRINCDFVSTGMYDCSLPNLILGEQTVDLSLYWTRSNNQQIIGIENDTVSTVGVMVDSDTDETNNQASITVQFSAVADVTITSMRYRGTTSYDNTVAPGNIVHYGQLGSRLELMVNLDNNGPSILRSGPSILRPRLNSFATVQIHIPVRDRDSLPNYYLYPASMTVDAGGADVTCNMSIINPDDLEAPPDTGGRRKRSPVIKRQMDPSAQDSPIPDNAVTKECSNPTTRRTTCQSVTCTIRNWNPNRAITISIAQYTDKRFFSTQSTPFVFTAYAEISLNSAFTNDNNMSNNALSSAPHVLSRAPEEGGDMILTIIVPIVAVIGAIILIAALFCLLYFVGFFRRKKYGEEAEGDFEVREVPPEALNGDKPGGLPSSEEVVPRDSTPNKEDPASHNDIGDASDLHDGEVATADNDPDETSL